MKFIQDVHTTFWYSTQILGRFSHQARPVYFNYFKGRGELKEDNFIQYGKYNTHATPLYKRHTTWNLYNTENTTKGGNFGRGFRGIALFPALGAKRHYQHRKDIIPYQAYVYIDIYCNQNKPIHCNARFEGNTLIPWC